MPKNSFPKNPLLRPLRSPADDEKIIKALNDLLDDPTFEASPRNKRFLRYVVEETLAGRGDRIKSYTIAIDVFGRNSDFNGSIDPVVRIEASRLRASLAKYYAQASNKNAVHVLLPRGRYIPEFWEPEKVQQTAGDAPEQAVVDGDAAPTTMDGNDESEGRTAATPHLEKPDPDPKPVPRSLRSPLRAIAWSRWALVAVLAAVITVLIIVLATNLLRRPSQVAQVPLLLVDQVEPLTDDDPTRGLARTLNESLISALQQFDGLAISRKPAGDKSAIAALLEKNPGRSVYLLASELRIDHDVVRLWWSLSDQRTMEVYWTSTQEGPWNPSTRSTEEEIATQVATAIAYRNGLVKSFEARTLPNPPPPGYLCVLSAQRYPLTIDAKTHAIARDCLEKTVALFPNNADAWAYLAIVYADEVRNGYNLLGTQDQALAKAKEATAAALRLAPFAASGYVASMIVTFHEGDFKGFEEAYRRAVQISPSDPRVLVVAGNRFWTMGRFEQGIALIKQASAINKNPGPFDRIFLAAEEYRLKNYRQALAILGTMPDSFYVVPATIVACYGELGDQESARPHIAKLLKLRPNYVRDMRRDARSLHYAASFIDAFADGLKKAGLDIVDDNASSGDQSDANKPR